MHNMNYVISHHNYFMEEPQKISPASSIYLKDIPENLFDEILKEQSEFRLNRGWGINKSKTVIKMLTDYLKCKEQNNFKSKYQ